MKKYFLKITAVVLLMGTLVSCSEDKVYYDDVNGKALASFTTAAELFGVTPTVSVDSIRIQISTVSKNDRKFTVELDTVETTATSDQYEYSSDMTVPAGKYYGWIVLKAKYTGDLTTKSADVVFNLKDFAGAHLEPNLTQHKVTIFQSCDYIDANVGVNFTAAVRANAYLDTPEKIAAPFNTTDLINGLPNMSQSKPREFNMQSLWGPNFVASVQGDPTLNGKYPAAGKIVINKDNTITIVPDESAYYIVSGSGNYDPCTNTMSYTLVETLFSRDGTTPNFSVTVQFTPNVAP